jgi:hypothetical protein
LESSLGVVQRSPLHRLERCASTPSVPASQARPATFGPGLPLPRLVPSLSFLPTSTAFSAHRLAGLLHPATDHGVRYVSDYLPRFLRAHPAPFGPGRRLAPPHFQPRQVGYASPPGPYHLHLAKCLHLARLKSCVPHPVASTRVTPPAKDRTWHCGRDSWDRIHPGDRLSRSAPPFGAFPSPAAVPRHRGHCLLAVRLRTSTCLRVSAPHSRHSNPSTTRPSSTVESVASRRVAAPVRPMLPWACDLPGRVPRELPTGFGGEAAQPRPHRFAPSAVAGGSPDATLHSDQPRETVRLASMRRHPSRTRRPRSARRYMARGGGCCSHSTSAARPVSPWRGRSPQEPTAGRLRKLAKPALPTKPVSQPAACAHCLW